MENTTNYSYKKFQLLLGLFAMTCLSSCQVMDFAKDQYRKGETFVKDSVVSKWKPQPRGTQQPVKRWVKKATPKKKVDPKPEEVVTTEKAPAQKKLNAHSMSEADADRLIVSSMKAILGSDEVKRVYFPHEGYECMLGGEDGERYVVTRVVVIGKDPETGKSTVGYEFVVTREADEAAAFEDKTALLKKHLLQEAAAEGSPMDAPR